MNVFLQHLLGVNTPQKIAFKFLLIAQTMHLPTYVVTDGLNFGFSLASWIAQSKNQQERDGRLRWEEEAAQEEAFLMCET